MTARWNTDPQVHLWSTLIATSIWLIYKIRRWTVYLQICTSGMWLKEWSCLANATFILFSDFLRCFPRGWRRWKFKPDGRNTSFTRRNHQTNLLFHFQILKNAMIKIRKIILPFPSYFVFLWIRRGKLKQEYKKVNPK